MNPFIAYPICSCFYSILLIYIYLSKKRIKSIENKIFILLAISNFLSLVGELFCYIGVEVYKTNQFLGLFILKNYIIALLMWILIYHIYNMLITNKNYGMKNFDSVKYVKRISKYVSSLFAISCIIIYLIPLQVYNDGIMKYTYGAGVDFITVIYGLCIFTWFVRFCLNFKKMLLKLIEDFWKV